ncbi:hypothetical protein NUW54_g9056 [Trametes sanguinea]|uniref:Uncharacterized protein n=1 Tax=Trametes sanguinea TaxID=158606 RepID=A0ACC1P9C8_9APHY|nr:hypothetical protein NUW54_g9056 [Trametes sanguinea]
MRGLDIAGGIVAEEAQDAVSRAVLERAEDQLTLRLDEHASHVENSGSGAYARGGEDREGRWRRQWLSYGMRPGLNVSGEPAAAVQSLTIDSAPTRVRRAGHVSRPSSAAGARARRNLQDDLGNRLTSEQVCVRARSAIDDMARAGLTPPGDGTVEEAKVLPHGGQSDSHADWHV